MLYVILAVGILGLGLFSVLFIKFGIRTSFVAGTALITGVVGLTAEMALNPCLSSSSYYGPWYAVLVICACYVAFLSIAYGFMHFPSAGQKDSGAETRKKAAILGFWVIVPPVWFAIDYFLIFLRPPAIHSKDAFEFFKYGQDVASKGWLALVTLLTGLYFGKDFTRS